MPRFFRCIEQSQRKDNFEKVFINQYCTIKHNTSLEIHDNQLNKHNVYEKLKYILTNQQLTNIQLDQTTRQHCRHKDEHCYPVFQPSALLTSIIQSYGLRNLAKQEYELSGVNLCKHESMHKPDQTHIELYFRSNRHRLQRIVINIHVQFIISKPPTHHSSISKALSSSHSISQLLGRVCHNSLTKLSNHFPKLDCVTPENHRHLGFYEPQSRKSLTPSHSSHSHPRLFGERHRVQRPDHTSNPQSHLAIMYR